MAVFRAMNTEVEVLDAPVEPVRALFVEWERRLSRFAPDSDLSALNGSAGRWVEVPPLLYGVLERAMFWQGETGGLFDPAVCAALERAGYDRSFEFVAVHAGVGVRIPARQALARTFELANGRVFLPEGVRLDLGGIAKGMAVDAASGLHAEGLVNAGGDVHAKGREYLVGVEDPREPERDVCCLRLRDCGVATSSTWKRRWAGGHHLIDPRTGAPSETDALAATVIAATTEEAEVAAKVALLLGLAVGRAWLERRGLAGLLIGRSGTLLASDGFEAYVAG